MSPAYREGTSRNPGKPVTPLRLAASARYRSRLLLKGLLSRAITASRKLWREDSGPTPFLRRNLWAIRRTYRPPGKVQLNWLTMDFKDILSRIADGKAPTQSELIPYLCLGGQDERAEVNAMLADAYSVNPTPGRLAQAKVFIQRAWLLSDFSPHLQPLYTRILSALGDTEGIRAAHKRLGMRAAERGNVAEAIRHFDAWHALYYWLEHQDKFEYDFDILSCMDQLAAARRPSENATPPTTSDGRIRIAYLLRGTVEHNSALMKISHILAELHDGSRFDLAFFVPEQASTVASSSQGTAHLRKFKTAGWHVATAPDGDNLEEALLSLAGNIRDWNPHLLVTSAALADFSTYFVTALRPAPLLVGLVQGPPPQFAPPSLDWCIVWSRHPLIDTPVGCSLVKFNLGDPETNKTPVYRREQLGIPRESPLLLSGGRHVKFQEPQFWQVISGVLNEHPKAYYVAAGPTLEQIPFFESVVPAAVRSRIRLLGWRDDFEMIASAADVIVDTYPNGGGLVLIEAMRQGIPVVSHRNDFMKPFDQTNWSPVEDFIPDSELVVERGDFHEFCRVLSRLVADEDYRKQMGEMCRQQVTRGTPEETIRHCEEIYAQLVKSSQAERGRH